MKNDEENLNVSKQNELLNLNIESNTKDDNLNFDTNDLVINQNVDEIDSSQGIFNSTIETENQQINYNNNNNEESNDNVIQDFNHNQNFIQKNINDQNTN